MLAKKDALVAHQISGVHFHSTVEKIDPISGLVHARNGLLGPVVLKPEEAEVVPCLGNFILYTQDFDYHYSSSDDDSYYSRHRQLEQELALMCSRLEPQERQVITSITHLNQLSHDVINPVRTVLVGLAP